MARRRRKATTTRRRRRGRPRRRAMRGLGALPKGPIRDAAPAVTGIALSAGATLGIRAYLSPLPGTTHEKVYRAAPYIGMGVGGLGAVAMYLLGGTGPAVSTLISSLATGGALLLSERVNASKPATATAPATAGLRAVVPEYAGLGSGSGLNAVVMEQQRGMGGRFGEEVNLQGTIDDSAFGAESFR